MLGWHISAWWALHTCFIDWKQPFSTLGYWIVSWGDGRHKTRCGTNGEPGEGDAVANRNAAAAGRYKGRSASERQAERRQRFLKAALELFGAGPGYRDTKVLDICKAAGLSTRQFYEEFGTLEDVLAELHLYVNDVAQQAVLDVLPHVQDKPVTERFTHLLRAYVKGAASDPRHARIAYVEIIGVSRRMDRQRLERRAVWIDFIAQTVDEAIQRGEAPPGNYRIAAAAFIGAVNGLMHDWVVGWVDATMDEIADELLHMVLGRYKLIDGKALRPVGGAIGRGWRIDS
jgi:AcrR family transcriptional regulator